MNSAAELLADSIVEDIENGMEIEAFRILLIARLEQFESEAREAVKEELRGIVARL